MRGWIVIAALIVAGCRSPEPDPTSATLRGAVARIPGEAPGDAFVLLYGAGDGPLPRGSGQPVQLAAVPRPRGFDGSPPDADFVFAELAPGRYSARAIVDSRALFDPFVPVLAQPFAGDADLGLVPVALRAGDAARVALDRGKITRWDPPMFSVRAPSRGVTLTADTRALTLLQLTVSPLPFARPDDVAFLYGTADADGDGQLDDFNGDGVPDPYPEVVLRRLPDPSDGAAFKGPDGAPLTIVIPAALTGPDPVGRDEEVDGLEAVNGLYAVIPPTAYVVRPPSATGEPSLQRLPSLPVGRYAITVIQANGQFWSVPNGLSPGGAFAANHGGPYPSQSARFTVVAGP